MSDVAVNSLEGARTSLLGLAVGDAFGSMLDGYGPELARRAAKRLISMKRPWRYFDANGNCLTDTWHETVEQAKAQARFALESEEGARRHRMLGAHGVTPPGR